MLNSTGRAACASAANIFVIRDGQVTTPLLSEGALPGVVRGALLEGAKAAGIVIEQAPVEAVALKGATLLLANSLIGLRPAVLRANEAVVDRASEEILARLKSCYAEMLQRDLEGRAHR